jgi:hypothetical protein
VCVCVCVWWFLFAVCCFFLSFYLLSILFLFLSFPFSSPLLLLLLLSLPFLLPHAAGCLEFVGRCRAGASVHTPGGSAHTGVARRISGRHLCSVGPLEGARISETARRTAKAGRKRAEGRVTICTGRQGRDDAKHGMCEAQRSARARKDATDGIAGSPGSAGEWHAMSGSKPGRQGCTDGTRACTA